MSRFLTVAKETWKRQMKSPSFWLMVFMPFIVLAISVTVGYFANKDSSDKKIAIVADSEMQDMFKNNDIIDFVFTDEKTAKNNLEKKEITAYAIINEEKGILNMKYYSSGMGRLTSIYLETIVKNIQNSINNQSANLSEKQARILTRNPNIEYFDVKDTVSNPVSTVLYFIMTLGMYIFLIMYSNIMIMDVAVEKGTKMLEFIFSSIRPRTYFAGKIFGNFLVILTHGMMYMIFGLIGFGIIRATDILGKIGLAIPDYPNLLQTIIIMILFAVFGILLYMIVAAMLGSLVSKQEDASKMASPLMIIPIACYALSFFFMGKNPNMIMKVLSFLPFFSTFFMPMRMIYSDANISIAVSSLLVLLGSIFVTYFICAKIYKKNILNYSSDKLFRRNKKVKLKKSVKSEEE